MKIIPDTAKIHHTITEVQISYNALITNIIRLTIHNTINNTLVETCIGVSTPNFHRHYMRLFNTEIAQWTFGKYAANI